MAKCVSRLAICNLRGPMREKIEFNKFSIVGDELHYVEQASSGKIS